MKAFATVELAECDRGLWWWLAEVHILAMPLSSFSCIGEEYFPTLEAAESHARDTAEFLGLVVRKVRVVPRAGYYENVSLN